MKLIYTIGNSHHRALQPAEGRRAAHSVVAPRCIYNHHHNHNYEQWIQWAGYSTK